MDDREMDRAAPTGVAGADAAQATDTTEGAEGAARSQHVLLVLPQDFGTIPQVLHGPLERLDRAAAAAGPQILIVTPDPETALAVADAALVGRDAGDPLVVPVTRPERAARQLAARPAPAVAGTPAALAALVRGASLKLAGVRTLVLAWADVILDSPEAAELDAVLAEVPRDAARVLVASEVTDAVEALVERVMRRPRRVEPAPRAGEAVVVSYITTAATARPAALRRVLDELDPVAAAVIVGSDASADEVRRTLRGLGYAAPETPAAEADTPKATVSEAAVQAEFDAAAGAPAATDAVAGGPALAAPGTVRVVRADAVPPHIALAVLYDLPTGHDALGRVAASAPGQIVALAQPRQLAALRDLAGGPVRALALGDAARRVRSRDELIRGELRAELERGLPPRELAVLEPVMAEYDAAEVAAAALRLLDRERARQRSLAQAAAAAAAPAATPAPAAFAPSGMTRLFVSAGSRDNVRPGDLVGAIAGEAGIPADKLGKIDVRESFSLVEVQSAEAERVIAKVTGISIRGRRVQVRPERDAGGERRPGPGGDRGDRGDRGGPPRGGPRGAGRPGGFDRGDRGDRGERGDRGPRGGLGGRDERGGGPGGPRGDRPDRGPRQFDRPGFTDGPRGFGGVDDRSVGERAEQRGEWAERAERLRNARRGPAAEAPSEASSEARGGGRDADDITES